MLSTVQGVFAFVLLWAVFYFLGATLLQAPSAFHDTTIDVGSKWVNE